MKKTAIIIVLVSAFAVRVWAASPGDVSAFAQKNGYAPADVAKLNSLIQAASSQGLASPLADKAREGIAKHVPAQQLLNVLRKMADRMQMAQQALPASLRTEAVVQAADLALAAGYSPTGVRSVAGAAGAAKAEAPRVQAAFYALGVLHDAGATEQGAIPFVAAQLKAGLNAAEIEDTTRAGARALRAGLVNNEELGRTSPDDLKGANRAEWRNLMNGVQAVRPGGTPAQVRGVIERRDAEGRNEKRLEGRGDAAAHGLTPPGQSGNGDDDHEIDDDDRLQSDDHLNSDRKR